MAKKLARQPTPRLTLSEIDAGYWEAMRKLLEKAYKFSPPLARNGVRSYRAMVAKLKVGDEVYHAPIAETAQGIVNGEYATSVATASPGKKSPTPTKTTRRKAAKSSPMKLRADG